MLSISSLSSKVLQPLMSHDEHQILLAGSHLVSFDLEVYLADHVFKWHTLDLILATHLSL